MSKAIDKVWRNHHTKLCKMLSKYYEKWLEGIIFKLERNGISGILRRLLNDFLVNRKQIVVLNEEQYFSWASIRTGVPQALILGPLLLHIYINDLTKGL